MRIYEDLRARIESGEFPVDSQLPGISALEEHYVTSLSTIRAAQQMLVEDGLISTEQGRGAFVRATISARTFDVDAAIADAIGQLQRARAALVAQRLRRVTFDLDEEGTYTTLSTALQEYADSMRHQAEGENNEFQAAHFLDAAAHADRLFALVDAG